VEVHARALYLDVIQLIKHRTISHFAASLRKACKHKINKRKIFNKITTRR
jgi:hypothetical protein